MRIFLNPLPAATFGFVVLCWVAFFSAFAFKKKPSEGKTTERKRERASVVGIALQGAAYAVA